MSETRMYVLHDVQPVSLNNAYATKHKWVVCKKGKLKGRLVQIPYRFKLEHATYLQYMIEETIAHADFENERPPLQWEADGFALTQVIYLPTKELLTQPYDVSSISPWEGSSLKSHDISNDFKLIEDAIFGYLGKSYTRINDTYNVQIQSYKRHSPDNRWHIVMLMTAGVSISAPLIHLGNNWEKAVGKLLASR